MNTETYMPPLFKMPLTNYQNAPQLPSPHLAKAATIIWTWALDEQHAANHQARCILAC
jgi:hypothetical protein